MVTVAVGAYMCSHAMDSSVAQFSQENFKELSMLCLSGASPWGPGVCTRFWLYVDTATYKLGG